MSVSITVVFCDFFFYFPYMCLHTCELCMCVCGGATNRCTTPPPCCVTVIFVVKMILWFQHLVPFQTNIRYGSCWSVMQRTFCFSAVDLFTNKRSPEDLSGNGRTHTHEGIMYYSALYSNLNHPHQSPDPDLSPILTLQQAFVIVRTSQHVITSKTVRAFSLKH